jgi:hypothetical protein
MVPEVTARAAPARKARELRRASRPVASTMALMSCGPAIMTIASGRTVTKLIVWPPR